MPSSFERKKREIKYSRDRRSRLRKAYFKLTGSERPAESLESLKPEDLDLDHPDSEDETKAAERPQSQKPLKSQAEKFKSKSEDETKLTKKQLASRKRMEKYREMKLAEERRKASEIKRKIHHKKATARTKKGQPKLGAQVGLLLDKIRESSSK